MSMPLSICAAVSSPSDLIVMPLATSVFFTSACAAGVLACGFTKMNAVFVSLPESANETTPSVTASAPDESTPVARRAKAPYIFWGGEDSQAVGVGAVQ